jgi:hypothetical protein
MWFIIIGFTLFVSCKTDLPESHYKSTDEATGGFNDFSLDLFSDGTFSLMIETSVLIEEKGTGSVWETKPKKVKGTWKMKDEKINYSFEEPKSSIDSVFFNTDFYDFIKKPILSFSQKLDTAYVYGIPCAIINSNVHKQIKK